MKATKTAFLILTLLSMVTTACSSLESKLVGEWQSNTQESVRLTITQGASANDGYHAGFSWTWNGDNHTQYWLIRNEDRGTILYLSSGGPGGVANWGIAEGIMQSTGRPHKVIELTSDKLVLEWNPDVNGRSETYEFHRAK
jgi:hypothetical protein